MDYAYHGKILETDRPIVADIHAAKASHIHPRARVTIVNAAVGLAVSILLHGVLIAWYLNRAPATDHSDREARRILRVSLLQSPPSLPPPTVALPRPLPQAKEIARTKIRMPKSITTQTGIPPRKARPEPAAPTTSHSPAPENRLDLDAIHASVGAIVARADRERRETPVGQLQAKPLDEHAPETKLARTIAGAARSDCKDRLANTGLLAPLIILTMAADKKDGGCKW